MHDFDRLAIDTYDFVTSMGGRFFWIFDPAWGSDGSTNPPWSSDGAHVKLADALTQRWAEWRRLYQEIYTRSPRLRLYDMMHDIGESHNASSWPMHEWRIADWVDAGDPSAPPPFDDRYDIVTPEFFEQLAELRRLCGGWLYWSDDVRDVVFAPEDEWQRVRAAQEETHIELQRKVKESLAEFELYQKRMPEIVALARADKSFWEKLRKWELDNELKRSLQLQTLKLRAQSLGSESIRGPILLVGSGKPSDLPVDPIFRDFLASVLKSDDMLKPGIVASAISMEVRRELGI